MPNAPAPSPVVMDATPAFMFGNNVGMAGVAEDDGDMEFVSTHSDLTNDVIVGLLEEMLVEDAFQAHRMRFAQIQASSPQSVQQDFERYSAETTSFITRYLTARMPAFKIEMLEEVVKSLCASTSQADPETSTGTAFSCDVLDLLESIKTEEGFIEHVGGPVGAIPDLSSLLHITRPSTPSNHPAALPPPPPIAKPGRGTPPISRGAMMSASSSSRRGVSENGDGLRKVTEGVAAMGLGKSVGKVGGAAVRGQAGGGASVTGPGGAGKKAGVRRA
ncbi:hypothetical protein HDU93_001077 [Gonapodya sp. JEL0774]|nr:hypothetical protein HDU93_001077 [Gonapodya sp. JEL0774]